ncbi:MAG: glycosyltransferase family 39 protein [Acidobacteria bacterium]|nr:glycosyltransferase family 39 protein [Acidobacteriota bacterium]
MWLLVPYSLLVLGYLLPCAATKPLWYDEIFTRAVVTLPSFQGSVEALRKGWDLQPPLYFGIVRASAALFGADEFGFRLPSVIGFWAGSVILYLLACRLIPPLFAALVLPLCVMTPLRDYAIEARPYALVFAFGAAALFYWHSTTRERPGRFAVPGLVMSLVALSTVHYYGFVTFAPVLAGEAAVSIRSRRARFSLWFVFAIAAVPLLLHWPLVRSGIRPSSVGAWNSPHPKMLLFTYVPFLGGLVLALVVLNAIFERWPLPCSAGPVLSGKEGDFPAVTACATAMAIPVIALLAAYGISGMVSQRHMLNWLIGATMLGSLLTARVLRHRARLGLVLLMAGHLYLVAAGTDSWRESLSGRESLRAEIKTLSRVAQSWPGLRVTSDDGLHMVVLRHYAPPELRSVLVSTVDPERRHPRAPEYVIDRTLLFFRGQSADYPTLTAMELLGGTPRFLFLDRPGRDSPLRERLSNLHAQLKLVTVAGDRPVYTVVVGQ